MKIGIIISTNESETIWNALRFSNFSLKKGDEVKVFFLGKGVEYQDMSTERFNVAEQAGEFVSQGGKMLACGSCIKSRYQEGSEMCPISTMQDLYEIVLESDKILTF